MLAYNPTMSSARTPLLELVDARVVREGRTILSVDRLTLFAGEHVAILGPNGSGKSTLVGVLTRDVRPVATDDGPVRLLARDRWDLFEARKLLGVVSADLQARTMSGVTVRELALSGFFGSLGIFRAQRPTPEMLGRVEALLQRLEIADLAQRRLDTLSTGEARRALVARALVHDPPVLVLDEPCDGLDLSAAYHLRGTLRDLAGDGRSLVLVTHHIDDLLPEVERVILLDAGRVVADGPKGEVLRSETLADLYGVPVHIEEREGWYRIW